MVNQNDNAQNAKSQCDMIAAWLECGFSITSLDALKRFDCMRLASRIHDLRERGMKINACKITTSTGKRVCEYVLAK